MGLWIIGSQDLFKTQIHSETNHLLCCWETCNNSTVALKVICSLQNFATNKHNVVFKIEHNMNFSFIELVNKIIFKLMIFGTKSALV